MSTTEELVEKFEAMAEVTPKNPKRYVFMGESNGSFTGNTKHLFLYFAKHRPDVESCYFTCNRETYRELKHAGLPVVLFPNLDSVEMLVSAGTVVVDSFDYKFGMYFPLTKGARIVQLWHGVGFKKIGFVEKESETSSKFNKLDLEHLYSGYDMVITTSEFYSEEVFQKSFSADAFEVFGYPRNDALLKSPTKESMLNCDMETFNKVGADRRDRKIILWTPTFRDQIGSPVAGIDFRRLHDFLDREKLHLVIKAHRLSEMSTAADLPHLSFYDNTMDVYPFMRLADVMVTDYSSIYMDYLLLDRPVVFYCPDYDEYVTYNREFQFPYDDMTPGPKCLNQDEFEAALKLAAYGDDGYGEARRDLCIKAFSFRDGDSSKRIADHLCGPLK
jgi:CDP-glycerol glycerophosphotransferase